MSTVVAVCRVHALLPDRGTVGVTAIDKRPADRPVHVRPLGLQADVQADRANHGGADQAVYAYAEEDADWWAAELGREIPPGLFGENLRTRGVDVSGAVIGERWRVGDTVLLEVTSPRMPCGTFARRMGMRDWVDRFEAHGAPGAYFRVLRSGDIAAGDAVRVESRPDHGVTIGRWFAGRDPDDARTLLAAEGAGEVRLQDEMRRYADQSLKKAARI